MSNNLYHNYICLDKLVTLLVTFDLPMCGKLLSMRVCNRRLRNARIPHKYGIFFVIK